MLLLRTRISPDRGGGPRQRKSSVQSDGEFISLPALSLSMHTESLFNSVQVALFARKDRFCDTMDILHIRRDVRFTPKADIGLRALNVR
jgi:hypothetical protein